MNVDFRTVPVMDASSDVLYDTLRYGRPPLLSPGLIDVPLSQCVRGRFHPVTEQASPAVSPAPPSTSRAPS
ncbi:hypothetical protein F2P81_020102 [Scophthalmus maximus]|uniref:Uncharacterized protein n=1 Tax=Scophthalmus maximus TaxID=52904 RepID=A0A6A4S8E3_SCOMX|nr:hypothetical protein F2P81_020102 [Scophthalmus maximus]